MSERDALISVPSGPTLAQIAGRVLNRPLLLHPDKVDLILHVLQGRLGIEPLEALDVDANRFVGSHRRDDGTVGSMRVENGVAILPIVGSLVNRGAWIGASSGLVSYEGLAAQLREVQGDDQVRAVILDIDSPGGEATGMFTISNIVAELNDVKPVVAFINDVAASAAYGIASAAREIIVSPTSVVGSIGVVLTHLDRSAALEKQGIKPTLIHAGAHKTDGHSFLPLSEAVRADLQTEVMKVYDQFVHLVAQGRTGRISAQAIRATQARTYLGADAVAQGLADRMASLEEVIASLSNMPLGAKPERTRTVMSKTSDTKAAHDDAPLMSAHDLQAALDAARAEGLASAKVEGINLGKAEAEAAKAEGVCVGRAEATARIKAIVTAAEAEGREAQALVLALDTAMVAEDATKVLAASPKTPHASSIAERAGQEAELGAETPAARYGTAERVAAGWSKAITQANARFG